MKDEFDVMAARLMKSLTETQLAIRDEADYVSREEVHARLTETAASFLRNEFGGVKKKEEF